MVFFALVTAGLLHTSTPAELSSDSLLDSKGAPVLIAYSDWEKRADEAREQRERDRREQAREEERQVERQNLERINAERRERERALQDDLARRRNNPQ
jgi:hypothetical protein